MAAAGRPTATSPSPWFRPNGSDAVDRVLEVTGLRAELPVHARREEAFVAVSGNSGRRRDRPRIPADAPRDRRERDGRPPGSCRARRGPGPLRGRRIADLKTVVTEACNNVVLHAYDDVPGPMRVTAEPGEGELEIEVADEGNGFRPQAERRAIRRSASACP